MYLGNAVEMGESDALFANSIDISNLSGVLIPDCACAMLTGTPSASQTTFVGFILLAFCELILNGNTIVKANAINKFFMSCLYCLDCKNKQYSYQFKKTIIYFYKFYFIPAITYSPFFKVSTKKYPLLPCFIAFMLINSQSDS